MFLSGLGKVADASARAALIADFSAWFDSAVIGVSTPFADGIVTKVNDTTAHYVTFIGGYAVITADENPDAVAAAVPAIGAIWDATYGSGWRDVVAPPAIVNPVVVVAPTIPVAPFPAVTAALPSAPPSSALHDPAHLNSTPSMLTDWNNYFESTIPGQVTPFAGGTLMRGTDNTAVFTQADGSRLTLTKDNPNFVAFAKAVPALASLYTATYGPAWAGTTPAPATTDQSPLLKYGLIAIAAYEAFLK